MSLVKRSLYPGEGGRLRHRWLPELREGGIDVQVAPIYLDPEFPEARAEMSLQIIQRLVDEIDANADDAALCLNAADIKAAVRRRQGRFCARAGGAAASSARRRDGSGPSTASGCA